MRKLVTPLLLLSYFCPSVCLSHLWSPPKQFSICKCVVTELSVLLVFDVAVNIKYLRIALYGDEWLRRVLFRVSWQLLYESREMTADMSVCLSVCLRVCVPLSLCVCVQRWRWWYNELAWIKWASLWTVRCIAFIHISNNSCLTRFHSFSHHNCRYTYTYIHTHPNHCCTISRAVLDFIIEWSLCHWPVI